MSSEEEKMCSTVVCLIIKSDNAYIANIGDSRAYMFRNNKLIKLTQDHSFVGERVRSGELTEEEARTHPRKMLF